MSDQIELVVVGAHLSGMPLNHELTNLGAQLLRSAKTTTDYKLFALNGGPPKRPGLFRVGKGEGAAIEVEVWALSPEAFGRFVANVPSPLAIGTIALSDGTSSKGFTVEAEGIKGAEDISRLGGWRAYMKNLVS
jgi:allophanate hydrolase